jgi:hypothetical protein
MTLFSSNTATGDYVSMFGTLVTPLLRIKPVHTFINPKDYVVTQTVTYPFGCIYVHTFIVERDIYWLFRTLLLKQ